MKPQLDSNQSATKPDNWASSDHSVHSWDAFEKWLDQEVEAIGYWVAFAEMAPKILRIYIDRPVSDLTSGTIGVEDCAKVSRELDEKLDSLAYIETIFPKGYDLEVSSPGLERPVKKQRDFERFLGREAKIQTLRPLTGEELANPDYSARNPKQKNFIGQLVRCADEAVYLSVIDQGGIDIELRLPFILIHKSNLTGKGTQ